MHTHPAHQLPDHSVPAAILVGVLGAVNAVLHNAQLVCSRQTTTNFNNQLKQGQNVLIVLDCVCLLVVQVCSLNKYRTIYHSGCIDFRRCIVLLLPECMFWHYRNLILFYPAHHMFASSVHFYRVHARNVDAQF